MPPIHWTPSPVSGAAANSPHLRPGFTAVSGRSHVTPASAPLSQSSQAPGKLSPVKPGKDTGTCPEVDLESG